MNKEEVAEVVDQRIFKHMLCLIFLGLAGLILYDLFSNKTVEFWNFLGHIFFATLFGLVCFYILD